MLKEARDGHSFVAWLKSCTEREDVEWGFKLHANLSSLGLLKSDLFVCSSLVDMYAKWGFLSEARAVFDDLLLKDAVVWNSLISGFVEHGHGSDALACFDRMCLESIAPGAITYTCSFKACAALQCLEKGKQLHVESHQARLLYKDRILGNALVDMYAKCGSLSEAKHALENLVTRDVFTWTALLSGYAENGYGNEALECFEHMEAEGIKPNAVTFVCGAKACASMQSLHKGLELHARIGRTGLLQQELPLGNAVLDMYVKCGALAWAREVFDVLKIKDVVSWTTLITGYLEHGHHEQSLKMLNRMCVESVCPNTLTIMIGLNACANLRCVHKGLMLHSQIRSKMLHEKDVVLGTALVTMYAKCGVIKLAQKVFNDLQTHDAVVWTALIEGYTQHGQGDVALKCFQRMQLEGILPDVFTYVFSLKACGSIGAMNEGQELHAEIERRGLLEKYACVGRTLVDMYTRFNRFMLAHQVFNKLRAPDVDSWNLLIGGHADFGNYEGALHMFECMVREGVRPDSNTFIVVLSAYGHVGLHASSHTYFEAMTKYFGIIPACHHHNSLVDVYLRAGQIDRAKVLIAELPQSPDRVLSRVVLAACRNCNSVALAKSLFNPFLC